MNTHYTVERMNKDDIALAIEWAREEGWNPGLNDARCFYLTDPHGFFKGMLDGKIIAIGSAVIYDAEFAFCGFYRVADAYRGQGFGLALTKARLAYIGTRNAGIDGVVSMLAKYERLGYKIAYNNARYSGTFLSATFKENPAIIPVTKLHTTLLNAYDRRHFPASRPDFLKCWIKPPGGKSLAYIKEGQMLGYGVIRPCYQGFKIGPLFADNATIADELFNHLANHARGAQVYIDIPECNSNAIALVHRYQLEKVFETARMYLKGCPDIAVNEIYGITSFELG
ncbi:MAG: GNAT family N-acetyltransferase [Legionella sp.]|nr:GNAT family N-acetyltransferase [Legionella sp.]